MIWRAVLHLATAAVMSSNAAADQSLSDRISELHSQCRSSSGDLLATIRACQERDRLLKTRPGLDPLNPQALAIAVSACQEQGLARGNQAWAKRCTQQATSAFSALETHRTDPLMTQYIWGACHSASGYGDFISPETVSAFALCAERMMKRCNEGYGNGYQLTPTACMSAIRSMGWLHQ